MKAIGAQTPSPRIHASESRNNPVRFKNRLATTNPTTRQMQTMSRATLRLLMRVGVRGSRFAGDATDIRHYSQSQLQPAREWSALKEPVNRNAGSLARIERGECEDRGQGCPRSILHRHENGALNFGPWTATLEAAWGKD